MLAQFRQVGLVEQTGNRVLHEIRIADVLVAIGIGAAHGFRFIVNRVRRPEAALFVVRAFENAEHLEQRDSA